MNSNDLNEVLEEMKKEDERTNYWKVDGFDKVKKENKPIKKLTLHTLEEFRKEHTFPPPKYIVESLIAENDFVILSAPAKAGKSHLAIDLALALANGDLFLERFQCVQSKVLYLQAELPNAALKQRLKVKQYV